MTLQSSLPERCSYAIGLQQALVLLVRLDKPQWRLAGRALERVHEQRLDVEGYWRVRVGALGAAGQGDSQDPEAI